LPDRVTTQTTFSRVPDILMRAATRQPDFTRVAAIRCVCEMRHGPELLLSIVRTRATACAWFMSGAAFTKDARPVAKTSTTVSTPGIIGDLNLCVFILK